MRVISGVHKGRRILAPKNLPVRPTTGRSKEGLFNILQHRLDFKTIQVLDLFAGTGSISYEFSSRGTSLFPERSIGAPPKVLKNQPVKGVNNSFFPTKTTG